MIFSGSSSRIGGPGVIFGSGVRRFTPASLFASGGDGYWPSGYDPAAGRVFQDSAGATPGVVSEPVGMARDALGVIDATQATALSRPTLGRVTKGGRRNLLTYTEQFDNAAWFKGNGSITSNADGTYDRFTPTATTNNKQIGRVTDLPFLAGMNSISVDVKGDGYQWFRVRVATGVILGISSTGTRPGNSYANFDLLNGVVGLVSGGGATRAALFLSVTDTIDVLSTLK